MPIWKYSPLRTTDDPELGDMELNQVQDGGTRRSPWPGDAADPEGTSNIGIEQKNQDEDDTVSSRLPYCFGMLVLLAIIYVLARTEAVENSSSKHAPFDIGSYRREKLASTTPHIIECTEATEGGSQNACYLPRKTRYEAVRQKGATLWMTGLSGSGKSTIAKELEKQLVLLKGKHVYRLDGDNIRTGLNRDLGFSADDRAESVRRVGEMSCLFSDSGTITVVSLVSPYRNDRNSVRDRHVQQGIPFFEIFMNVSLDVVTQRDPKGLYKQVKEGKLKDFTGVDAPYEPPTSAEIVLPNDKMTVDECVQTILKVLHQEGLLNGAPNDPMGLPLPDGDTVVDLLVPSTLREARRTEAKSLPTVSLTDIDLNWLQTVAEGWASPLKGFMRENVLLQVLHFSSFLVDTHNTTGYVRLYDEPSELSSVPEHQPPLRASMSIPIILPCTDFTKLLIESSKKHAVALSTKDGVIVAILRQPEVYRNRKEEIVTRIFGAMDSGHPYVKHILHGGDWLIGGDIELLEKISYGDGMDKWRLDAKELREEFFKKGADVVYAFQTRNPTHAGHAYLINTAGERLKKQGYEKPILWLSPLGGWTKSDDVPLDVRVKQHEAVLKEGMLDPDSTVMAIWPAPMMYAGPTEVQFHAKSRRCGGASQFVVGRDPAGMKRSLDAEKHPGENMYREDDGKYVLAMSPGLGEMKLLDFDQVYYDKAFHTMRTIDPSRPDDFISISGSAMRNLARNGAQLCKGKLPSDPVKANCVPPGFMPPSGWEIMKDYYQNVEDEKWVPYSRRFQTPRLAKLTKQLKKQSFYGTRDFRVYITSDHETLISPWHDILLNSEENHGRDIYNMVVEIPMFSTVKLEMQKSLPYNPIAQDIGDDGHPRYYTYGAPIFNYGFLPRTWEDPEDKNSKDIGGDGDPLDVIEIGEGPLPLGSIIQVKVIGILELIDQGEVDYKILAIRWDSSEEPYISTVGDLEEKKPGIMHALTDWLINYKTSDGAEKNVLKNNTAGSKDKAIKVINKCSERYQSLLRGDSISTYCLGIDTDGCNYTSPLQ